MFVWGLALRIARCRRWMDVREKMVIFQCMMGRLNVLKMVIYWQPFLIDLFVCGVNIVRTSNYLNELNKMYWEMLFVLCLRFMGFACKYWIEVWVRPGHGSRFLWHFHEEGVSGKTLMERFFTLIKIRLLCERVAERNIQREMWRQTRFIFCPKPSCFLPARDS